MRNHISLELSPYQVESLIERLPIEMKIRLVRRLERETGARKLDSAVSRMRSRVRRVKVSAKAIDHICEEVKREYDEKYHRH